MAYQNISDLPDNVKNVLPKHAKEIYLAAFNNAWEEYKDPDDRKGNDDRETTAHKVAWAAVKQKYEKKDGKWQESE